jgi:hypothetical protein
MSYDIPLHIPDNTPEALWIQSVMSRDHVSPEEAVRSALRGMANQGAFPATQTKLDRISEQAHAEHLEGKSVRLP